MLLARRMLLSACLSIFFAGCAPFSENPVAPLLKGRRAAVVVFLAPDCPLSQNYSAALNELREKFRASGVEFYGVFAGRAGVEGAENFVKTYSIQFPVLPDVDFRMADFLGATATPEVFVLDGTGRSLYGGAIDNRAPRLGQRRTVVTENYLLDALESVVKGRPVLLQKTPPVGCFLERTRSS